MGVIEITRDSRVFSWTLHTATANVATMRLEGMAGGVVSVGTMLTASATLQLFGSLDTTGPFRRLYDSSGSAADITLSPSTAEGRMYSLPDAAFALPYVKVVSGTTNSTGVIAFLTLKS
jgi:hypothetical protein